MHLLFATMIDNPVQLMAVIVVIGAVLGAIIVPTAALYFKHKREQLWHETARVCLEKGLPLPALPAATPSASGPNHLRDARTGLILMGLGAGIWLGLRMVKGNSYLLGTVPAFIGLGLLLFALLAKFLSTKTNSSTDSAPRT